MITFKAILINNINRLAIQKARVLFFVIMTIGALIFAVWMNRFTEIVGHIAVVSEYGTDIPDTNKLKVTRLEIIPTLSELVAGRYDAVVVFCSDGTYEITTIKSEEFKLLLDTIIKDPSIQQNNEIGVRAHGTNILGFMMMFMLMQGIAMTFLFGDEKELKQIERIAVSPTSFLGYLSAHYSFVFIILFIPATFGILAANYLFGVDIGLQPLAAVTLIAFFCALAASFSLFLTAIVRSSDSANMIGSAIVILTSILAGSFYPFEKGNRVLESLIQVLPQKAFLSLSELVETGSGTLAWYPYCLYITALIIVFFSVAVLKIRKDYLKV